MVRDEAEASEGYELHLSVYPYPAGAIVSHTVSLDGDGHCDPPCPLDHPREMACPLLALAERLTQTVRREALIVALLPLLLALCA